MGKQWLTLFWGAPKSLQMVIAAMKLKDAYSLQCLSYDNLRQWIKKQIHHFAIKDLYSQSYIFSSSHVWIWKLDHKEGWALQNGCFWTVVPEKTLESSLDSMEIKPVNPKGNQPWVFIGRTDAKVEAPILRPPDVKHGLIWKDPDSGKDWEQEEKRAAEDVMVGWHHWLNGHEFEQTPGEWRTENTGVLQSMGSQRVGHNLATEQQQIIKKVHKMKKFLKI